MKQTKRYTVTVVNNENGEQVTHHLEGLALFGIQQRMDFGITALRHMHGINPREIKAMFGDYLEDEKGKRDDLLRMTEADLDEAIKKKLDAVFEMLDNAPSIKGDMFAEHDASNEDCPCLACMVRNAFEKMTEVTEETETTKTEEAATDEKDDCDCPACRFRRALFSAEKDRGDGTGPTVSGSRE